MISAWKRLMRVGENGGESGSLSSSSSANGMPAGVQKLDKELQRKFARGVNYNMKVIIKGDNRVGKTSLFLRLRGYGFDDNYTPTDSLNVTSIDWNYKATDDIVKIDLWEAIDATSKKTVSFVDLKMENNNNNPNTPTFPSPNAPPSSSNINNKPKLVISSTILTPNGNLGPIPESAKQSLTELSETLNVYKGADAVLLVMDMTKLWTFKYVQNELPRVPKHIPVLVIANFRDQGHHRTVSSEQAKAFIEAFPRDPCDGPIMYTEASMKNGFGMRLIEKFLNVPFLKLQEASLLKQLELNRQEYMATREELQIMQATTNEEYEQYLELETIKRRQQADALSPINSGLKQLDETTREQIRNTTVSPESLLTKVNAKTGIESKSCGSSAQVTAASQSFVNDRLPSIVIGAKCPLPDAKAIKMSAAAIDNNSDQRQHLSGAQANEAAKDDDENYGPTADDESEDEEVPRANPLVANYQSDLDSDDQIQQSAGTTR